MCAPVCETLPVEELGTALQFDKESAYRADRIQTSLVLRRAHCEHTCSLKYSPCSVRPECPILAERNSTNGISDH